MNCCQIVAGRDPPVTPRIGDPSSLPTHTPTTNDSLKPMNHASLWFWVVPVLPAAKPASAARCAVPRSTVRVSSLSISSPVFPKARLDPDGDPTSIVRPFVGDRNELTAHGCTGDRRARMLA